MHYRDNEHKTVIVVKAGTGAAEALNAAAHLALGFSQKDKDAFGFQNYIRGENTLAVISTYPVIVMTAKSNAHIARLIEEAKTSALNVHAFTRSMIGSSLADQLQAVAADESPDYLAAIVFGPSETLRGLTKRFSLMSQ